jgi:hydrogenase expression/formation protein HypC
MCLAIPGRVVDLHDDGDFTRAGRVDFGGVVREVNLSCVPEAGVGDYVIVHVGMALSTIDEKDAQLVFEFLRQQGETEEWPGETP